MLIGDWDRHEDQWLWAAFKELGKTIYKPIPRDRDQAFSRMDGIIPELATKKWGIRKVQDFDYTIHDLKGLNINGGALDRNFTTKLSLHDWVRTAEELQYAITNDVIAAAFREMPDPIYNISGKKIVARLKRRRDDLVKCAVIYYKFLSEQVNITGTSGQETFEVNRLNDDSTEVIVYKHGNGARSDREIFNRVFLRSETKEIRLYGLDGSDEFIITGDVKKGILIRVIGGHGEDTISDESSVKQAGSQTKIYNDRKNVINTIGETKKYI